LSGLKPRFSVYHDTALMLAAGQGILRQSFALWAMDDFGLPFRPDKKSFFKATGISRLYANAFPEPVFK